MKKILLIILAIILLSFVVAFYFYPIMPGIMASHWDINGHVNGYMSKAWALFFTPSISLFILLLWLLIPTIDPLRDNIRRFRKYFDGFILLMVLFIFYLFSLTIIWNLGFVFDMAYALIPALAAIFYFAGILTENAKRNWFIGIRTPWTLSSDKVWEKTNTRGGLLFKIIGILVLLGLLSPRHLFAIFFLPMMIAVIYLVVYSYFEYKKETKKGSTT